MQTTNIINAEACTPAKRTTQTPTILMASIIIIAIASFGSGWFLRGYDQSTRDTAELSLIVKDALGYAQQSQSKDKIIEQLTTYCAPGSNAVTQ